MYQESLIEPAVLKIEGTNNNRQLKWEMFRILVSLNILESMVLSLEV
jgi:hypothetical protein